MKLIKFLIQTACLLVLGVLALGWWVESRKTPEQKAVEEKQRHKEVARENEMAAARAVLDAKDKARRLELDKEAEAKMEPYLEELVAIEGVQRAEFDGLDLIKVRLAPLMHVGRDHVRVMCENIAKGWASRAGRTYVRCESWYGNEMYAKGTYEGPVPAEYLARVLAPVLAEHEQKRQAMTKQAQIAMQGKTMAEIEGVHGPAKARDPITGWAEWAKFRARFRDGKVFDVEAY